MDISLKMSDYKRIMSWFELAFAKNNEIAEEDNATFRKISVMAMAYMEENAEDNKKHE
tara:strand:- start:1753 stop:1926 length:174 start_codon:yes stop_codon:yes gene_type:complete